MAFLRAGNLDDLWDGEMRGISLGERKVLLVNVGGKVTAFVDRCAHQSFPMSRGTLVDGQLVCGAHQWIYDARTGKGINPPGACLRALPIRVEAGSIWVDPEGVSEEVYGGP